MRANDKRIDTTEVSFISDSKFVLDLGEINIRGDR